MAKLAIFDDARERWVQFDEDTEVLIAYLDMKALAKAEEKADKKARLSKQNPKLVFNQKLGEVAVKGWRKIGEPGHPGIIVKGRPLEFSAENRDMLMMRSVEFARFVNTSCVDSELFDVEEDTADGPNA